MLEFWGIYPKFPRVTSPFFPSKPPATEVGVAHWDTPPDSLWSLVRVTPTENWEKIRHPTSADLRFVWKTGWEKSSSPIRYWLKNDLADLAYLSQHF